VAGAQGRRKEMGKEALTCGPGAPAGERKRGEWEMGHRWKAGSDRWEAEAGGPMRGGRCGAADGNRGRQPMGMNWGIGRRGKEKKGAAGGLLADFSFLSLLIFSFSN
jgi:hypothetical protein